MAEKFVKIILRASKSSGFEEHAQGFILRDKLTDTDTIERNKRLYRFGHFLENGSMVFYECGQPYCIREF